MNNIKDPPGAIPREVGAEAAGQRIDNWLLRYFKGIPKSHIYRLIRTGQVRVNGKRIKPTYRLMAGDSIRIPPVSRVRADDERAPSNTQPPPDYPVLFEDDDFLVLNKPAGLSVHGGTGIASGIIERLRASRPEGVFLELAHRLDRATSGCLVIAKSRTGLVAIHTVLRAGQLNKGYLALLKGSPSWTVRTVEDALAKNQIQGGERVSTSAEGGKRALSHFRIVRRWPEAVLAEIRIETGRTHQIRVHAASLGHPIAGDEKYGERAFNREFRTRYGLRRLFLHARSLSWVHPGSQQTLAVQAPLPAELDAVLHALEEAHPSRAMESADLGQDRA